MKYVIYYHHTFGCDLIYAKTKKEARKKAIKILKKEFNSEERKIMYTQGIPVNSCGKKFVCYRLRDLIEDIEIDNLEEEED